MSFGLKVTVKLSEATQKPPGDIIIIICLIMFIDHYSTHVHIHKLQEDSQPDYLHTKNMHHLDRLQKLNLYNNITCFTGEVI